MAVNILLADDHRMVREGIRCLLENVPEFNVVGEAADGYECISLVNKTKPNILYRSKNNSFIRYRYAGYEWYRSS